MGDSQNFVAKEIAFARTSGDLAHVSPLGWEHINLTGDYRWDTSPTLGPDEFRPLRTHVHDFAAAA